MSCPTQVHQRLVHGQRRYRERDAESRRETILGLRQVQDPSTSQLTYPNWTTIEIENYLARSIAVKEMGSVVHAQVILARPKR